MHNFIFLGSLIKNPGLAFNTTLKNENSRQNLKIASQEPLERNIENYKYPLD